MSGKKGASDVNCGLGSGSREGGSDIAVGGGVAVGCVGLR